MADIHSPAQRYTPYIYLAIGVAYWFYVLARAIMVPITIDEGYTILNYVDLPVWKIITYQYPDVSANNHILNTLSIKFFGAVFGRNMLTVRLGALAGGLLYAGVGVALARRWCTDLVSGLSLLLLWFANPYLAEMFAIGRGYGLSIGLMVFSIWHAWRWLQVSEPALRPFLWALAGAWLAVAANFTLLNYYLFLSVIVAWQLLRSGPGRHKREFLALGVSTALLAAFLYSPLRALVKANEFEKFGVNGFYKDMLFSFVRCGFRGAEYFGEETYPRFAWWIAAIGVTVGVVALGRLIWKRGTWDSNLWFTALLPGVMAVNATMTLATQATWLPGRTNVFFYPLLVLSIGGALMVLPAVLGKLRATLLLVLALPMSYHFLNCINLSESFEWWFDRDTFKVLDYVKNVYKEEKRDKRIRFNCFWIYNPSFSFHLKYGPGRYKDCIEPDLGWISAPKPEDNCEFFYADRERKEALMADYDLVWVVQPGERYLLRRKAAAQ